MLISPKALLSSPHSLSMKCKAHFSRWGDKELVVWREKEGRMEGSKEGRKGKRPKQKGSQSNCCNPLSASSAAMPASSARSVWPEGFTPFKDLNEGFRT